MKFFDYLNSRHPNVNVSFEKQNGGKLAFLDILISNENDSFCTSVFRKKTSIGLYTNFTSFTPFSYRIELKFCFTVLSKLVVLGLFLIKKNKQLKIC